ncbi:glycosyltransferase [Aliiroseovarius sp. KMU-71]|uniref:glycosyltransferase n=1 Tax=Aliiroseovarius sp. KMU-71 TaxID=3453123 RepID=UPI003F4499A4
MLLSEFTSPDSGGEDVPPELLDHALSIQQTTRDPQEAEVELAQLLAQLRTHRFNPELVKLCGLLYEKKRKTEGMLDFWQDVHNLLPEDPLPVRMLMRWYRRHHKVDEGIDWIQGHYPDRQRDLIQAGIALTGLIELQALVEIDAMMQVVLERFPEARPIRMSYIKYLMDQTRFLDAQALVAGVRNREKMGKASQDLLARLEKRAKTMQGLDEAVGPNGILAEIVRIAVQWPRRCLPKGTLGPIAFVSGQLGVGGAERQLTRIASAMNDHFHTGTPIGDCPLSAPVRVCVRHANAANNANFFLPVLRAAGVETTILTEVRNFKDVVLDDVPQQVLDLLELLPDDILQQILKLVCFFRDNKIDVAYVWQDGAVLTGSVAAIIAGVPRVITSFRGLPPNLRPRFLHPQMTALYRALAQVPFVSFSSNAQASATAYEDWLELAAGAVHVIPNAIPPVQPEGDVSDQALWDDICARSPGCSKTVIGVFRFDANKRHDFWIETAAARVSRCDDTRFILVGTGMGFDAAKAQIDQLGMQDRIFQTGARSHVGFYLHKADTLMHLARMEGLPNVVIEAQLAGLPVLCTPAGGSAEIVYHDETGYLLADAAKPSSEELAMFLDNILDDDKLRGKLASESQSRAECRFLPETVLKQTVDLIFHTNDGTP